MAIATHKVGIGIGICIDFLADFCLGEIIQRTEVFLELIMNESWTRISYIFFHMALFIFCNLHRYLYWNICLLFA